MNANELILLALGNTYRDLRESVGTDNEGRMAAHVKGIEARKGRGSFVEQVTDEASLNAFMRDVCSYGDAQIIAHDDVEAELPGTTIPPCTYIRFNIPTRSMHDGRILATDQEYTARMGVTTIDELLANAAPGETLPVTVRRSVHDTSMLDDDGAVVKGEDGQAVRVPTFEHVMQATSDDCPRTWHGWIIVGPGDNGPMIWTWHPGDLSASPTRALVDILSGIVVKLSV